MANEELKVQYPGGSHAPPLTDELLAKYKELAAGADQEVGDDMRKLLACCEKWWELPVSTKGEQKLHQHGMATIQVLDDDIQKALWDHIPWMKELEAMKGLFEGICAETKKELRNAAHHLLWHAIELCLDREPITKDKMLA